MAVFERQFGDENGKLVYRRYGKGPAYRVSDSERDALIEGYVREYRKNYMLMSGLMVIAILGPALFFVASGVDLKGPLAWSIGGSPLMLAAIWFVWASHAAIVRPGQQFWRSVPMAPALLPVEARRKALSQVSYGMLAIMPFLGLLIVARATEYLDVWTGWGRLVWLVPAGLSILAARQAVRRFRTDHA